MGAPTLAWLSHYLPILRWIRSYKVGGTLSDATRRAPPAPPLHHVTVQIREHLVPDVIAGVTVGIMAVPQGMSYAQLAGLRPQYGLYTDLFPMALCTSPRVCVSTQWVIRAPVRLSLPTYRTQISCLGRPSTSFRAPPPSCHFWCVGTRFR